MFEKEDRLAAHQTGRNSGVVHAGLYYQPGSAKAVLCRRGVGLLEEFCAERGIRRTSNAARCWSLSTMSNGRGWTTSKSVRSPTEYPVSASIGPEELRELEPHVRGVAALHSPSTSIVDFAEVTQALAADAVAAGAKILLGHEVIGLRAAR